MILTIGMIVKNEEKWLDKCLSAIKPILDNVDSELIITDTGSTDRTVEIAKKYTDKVLNFDWINDFSAARNYGLEKACGEWFMMLDADDIFESCDQIIRFFNSGEYKRYNSATYIGKNICDSEGRYIINKQPRLTKLLKNTKFIYAVHEVLNTYGNPKKDLTDAAVHFGYYYENEESKEKKYIRNNELLLKRLEDEKDTNAYLYVQFLENEGDRDIDKAIEYAIKGIEVAEKTKNNTILTLLVYKSFLEMSSKRYDDAMNTCKYYFSLDKEFRPFVLTSDMEIYAIQALCLYNQKKYSEAAEKYIEFFRLHKEFSEGKLNTFETDITILKAAADYNFVSHVIHLLICLNETKQYDLAYKYIKTLYVYKYIFDYSPIDSLVDSELETAKHLNYQNIGDYVINLDENAKRVFVKKLTEILYYSQNKSQILEALNNVSDDKIKNDLYKKYFGNEEITIELLSEYAKKHRLNEEPDILLIAMDKGCDISSLISQPELDIGTCVKDLYTGYYGFNTIAERYDVCIFEDAALKEALTFYESCIKCTRGFKSPKPNVFITINANRLLEKYGMIGKRLAEYENAEITDEIIAADSVGKAFDLRKNKKYKECFAELKNAVGYNSELAKFVSDYSDEVVSEYNAFTESQKQTGNEMELLATAIKNSIRINIKNGNIKNAKELLLEYKSLCPNDEEIIEIEKLLIKN